LPGYLVPRARVGCGRSSGPDGGTGIEGEEKGERGRADWFTARWVKTSSDGKQRWGVMGLRRSRSAARGPLDPQAQPLAARGRNADVMDKGKVPP